MRQLMNDDHRHLIHRFLHRFQPGTQLTFVGFRRPRVHFRADQQSMIGGSAAAVGDADEEVNIRENCFRIQILEALQIIADRPGLFLDAQRRRSHRRIEPRHGLHHFGQLVRALDAQLQKILQARRTFVQILALENLPPVLRRRHIISPPEIVDMAGHQPYVRRISSDQPQSEQEKEHRRSHRLTDVLRTNWYVPPALVRVVGRPPCRQADPLVGASTCADKPLSSPPPASSPIRSAPVFLSQSPDTTAPSCAILACPPPAPARKETPGIAPVSPHESNSRLLRENGTAHGAAPAAESCYSCDRRNATRTRPAASPDVRRSAKRPPRSSKRTPAACSSWCSPAGT